MSLQPITLPPLLSEETSILAVEDVAQVFLDNDAYKKRVGDIIIAVEGIMPAFLDSDAYMLEYKKTKHLKKMLCL